jgi:isocitrate dehydrogenase
MSTQGSDQDSTGKPSQGQASPESAAPEGDKGRTEALYDRFTERVRELIESSQKKSKEAVDKAVEKAMETAREQIAAAGEFSAEQGELFKKYMRRDLAQTEQDMLALGKEAKERLHPARLGAGALSSISRLLDATGAALQSLSRHTEEALTFNTGDITMAGTLTCTQCGQKVQLKHTTRIPPCPSCHGTQFRKGY